MSQGQLRELKAESEHYMIKIFGKRALLSVFLIAQLVRLQEAS
ncbi:hypothetical protein C4J92_5239 [Pseudomonas sp. R3-18-08]|nr:hypothetical protein C4J92_5239 [Pseudomonas sp. R3-18-08]